MHRTAAALCLALLGACSSEMATDFDETTIAMLHDQMQRGDVTSEQLVNWYTERFRQLDEHGPRLNSIIEINPDALQTARALDEEWQRSGPRGPMHGIPVLLKANIDTGDDMVTSAGSLALATHRARNDAFLVSRLREAGAVVLGKTNLSEWANFRSTRSSSGWSSVDGQTVNAYDPARSPCGSSSGSATAVAANLTVAAIGTETNGSVVCPSGANGIVGIKPTVGLISRSGIIPIAASQDTAGPMARTVRDAAILLSAMTGFDTDDSAMQGARIYPDYAANLAADGLDGKRIGVIRSWYGSGSHEAVDAIYAANIETLREAGAVIVDDLEYDLGSMGDASYQVLLYEFKHGLNAYLAAADTDIKTLADVIKFNRDNAARVMPHFGQEILLEAEATGTLDDEDYKTALAETKPVAQSIIDGLLSEHELDALVAPSNGPAWMIDHINGDVYGIHSSSLAARAGYPNITVPAGFVSGMPVGLSFFGAAWNEKQLIEIAYAFEQTTNVRKPPEF